MGLAEFQHCYHCAWSPCLYEATGGKSRSDSQPPNGEGNVLRSHTAVLLAEVAEQSSAALADASSQLLSPSAQAQCFHCIRSESGDRAARTSPHELSRTTANACCPCPQGTAESSSLPQLLALGGSGTAAPPLTAQAAARAATLPPISKNTPARPSLEPQQHNNFYKDLASYTGSLKTLLDDDQEEDGTGAEADLDSFKDVSGSMENAIVRLYRLFKQQARETTIERTPQQVKGALADWCHENGVNAIGV